MEDLKETFINILSHDLKTPLLAQAQSLKMLSNGNFGRITCEQHQILELVTGSCRNLLEMIENVLEYLKLENNELGFNCQDVSIQKVVEEVCSKLDKSLEDKELKMEISFPSGDIKVFGDYIFLQKALFNIIENCVTYAHRNTIINLKCSNSDRNTYISVAVKGDSLSEDILNSLFDYNSEKSLTHTKIGVGMKLSLALKIIQAHFGRITARRGACGEVVFDVILPITLTELLSCRSALLI